MGEPLHYGRVPVSVIADERLKARDIRVYATISSTVFQGNVSKMGTRRIAEISCTSRRLVLDSIRQLVNFGHLELTPGAKRGQRSSLVLTSPVFAQKQRDGVREIAQTPSGGKRLVSAPRRKTA